MFALKNEKNVYTIYYLDKRGNIISTFEGENSNDLHTTSKDMGISLGFEGTLNDKINGHKAKNVNGAGQTAVLETTVYSSTFAASYLDSSQNLALNFWLRLKSSPQRANLTVKATLSGGSVYSKSVVLNVDAQDAWQQISVPIARGTKAITKITVSVTNEWGENVNTDICNFYMRKGEKLNLYFTNNYTIDDLKTMTVNGYKYFLKLDPVYLTESDVLNTLRAKAKGNNYLICNNGRKRFSNLSSITFQTENNASFTISSMSSCRVESIIASNRKKSTKYYSFTSGGVSVEESILATRGDATLDNATSSEKVQALIVQMYDSYGNKTHESDIYGKETDYEYNNACEVKKITQTADGETIVTYDSEEDGEEYKTAEMQGFDAQGFSYYKPFGTIDTVTEKSYNVSSGTYSNTTSKSKNTYNGFMDELSKVTAMNGSSVLGENVMTYPDGNTFIVTDGNVKYKSSYYNANNETTWSVYEGAAEKILKKQSVTESSTGTTDVEKYYNSGTTSPTYTETTIKNRYGREVNKGAASYNYYTDRGESPSCIFLESMTDNNINVKTEYGYDMDDQLRFIITRNMSDSQVLLRMEKIERLKLEYTFGIGDSYQMLILYDDTFAGSTRVKGRTVTINGNLLAIGSWTYDYDAFDRINTKTNNIGTYEYAYLNGLSNPTECIFKFNGSEKVRTYYEYNTRGQISMESEFTDGGTFAKDYTYDGLNRLISEKITKNGSVTLDRTYAYDTNGRMTSFGGNSLTYDSRGRLTGFGSKTFTYDNYGNRTSDGIRTYTWTRGRLLSNLAGVSYTYDVTGKRFTKTVNGVTSTYFYDGNDLLAENKSNGQRLRYFYDNEGICGFRYYNGSSWSNYMYVKNAKGDVLEVVNENGTVVAVYSYDAWGNCTIESQSGGCGNVNPIRYHSYYYDRDNNLYYLLTRYYDPTIGQFISPDGFDYLKPETVGLVNLYVYCSYNPIIGYDPTGEASAGEWVVAGAVILTSVVAAIFTAGTSAVLMGAFAGLAFSGAVSIATQVQETGDFDFTIFAIDSVAGAISGALAATGLGLKAQTIFNGLINLGDYMLSSLASNEKLTFEGMFASAVSGAFAGLVGKDGAKYGLNKTKDLVAKSEKTSAIVLNTLKAISKSATTALGYNMATLHFN